MAKKTDKRFIRKFEEGNSFDTVFSILVDR